MKYGYKKNQMMIALDDIFKIIAEALIRGESVNIPGFGYFDVREHKEHMGTDPSTHEKLMIPAYRIPKFTPSKILKTAVRNSSAAENSCEIEGKTALK